ncbi:MAG: helix-turn-helix transcriptional regulator [Clostridia bacterium]|nr:helix-turn-helix transcriptional regulator [Clostridia bacterium]
MIKELKEMGLSQSMIAREMGSNRQTVNEWFLGKANPSARSISRMAEAMTKLTGKTITPADVYLLIDKVVKRVKEEKGNN